MLLSGKVRQTFEKLLSRPAGHGTAGPRLVEDAQRLFARVQKFLEMNLLSTEVDLAALELACFALQLPLRAAGAAAGPRLGRTNLRQRAQSAAALLQKEISGDADEALLAKTVELLAELPQRSTAMDEAKLLSDAVNLEDFGVCGLISQAIDIARQGGGVTRVADGCEKREQYGYWDARLKEGFHFDAVRQIALRRLASARQTAEILLAELKEDQPSS